EIETHILDFDSDVYSQSVEVVFHKKLREEKAFDSIDELVKEIQNNIRLTRKYFSTVTRAASSRNSEQAARFTSVTRPASSRNRRQYALSHSGKNPLKLPIVRRTSECFLLIVSNTRKCFAHSEVGTDQKKILYNLIRKNCFKILKRIT
ncbi:MAG: riboflavin kinase, partial [Bacteroidales bacterium]|nr:riboflavin kinase [Bacteroidales bacterium]